MRVRLLPSNPRDHQIQALTSYLIDDSLVLDAGCVGLALTTEAMQRVRNVIITHAHIDHIATLPILVAEVFDAADSTITVHALPEVVAVLRNHVFNGEVWPDFEQLQLPNGGGAALGFRELQAGTPVRLGDYLVTPIPVNHTVPTAGFVIEKGQVAVAVTSDTYRTEKFWEVARETPHLKAIFVDVSYPNHMEDLAGVALHLTPKDLEDEMRKLGREMEVYAVHLKQSTRAEVRRQLGQLRPPVDVVEIGREYRWES